MTPRNILKVTLVLLLSSLAAMAYVVVEDYKKNKAIEAATKKLPRFTFFSLDGRPFTLKNLITGQATIINYFSPDCEECKQEAEIIWTHRKALEEVQLLMVSPADSAMLRDFYFRHHWDKIPQVKILIDLESNFDQCFGKSTIPTHFAYDRMGNLIMKKRGKVDFEALLKACRE